MSMQIDWTQPLSKEAKEWALQFPAQYGELVRVNEQQFPPEDSEPLDGVDDEEVLPYDQWVVRDLQAEIERRNRQENANLSTAGNKAQLVRTLEEDDRKRVE